jgi:chitin synthase
MRVPSNRRKNTIKRTPTLGDINKKEHEDEDANAPPTSGGTPCIAGEFRSALDTLFETLEETQPWFVFCINPNDSQLPNQLEGCSVKGQIRSVGLPDITKGIAHAFPVGMTHREFVNRYREPLAALGISEGSN